MDVVDSGSDQGQMVSMVRQIEQRYAHRPPELLVVGGFARLEQIGTLVPGTTVYAPVPEPRGPRVIGMPPVAATAVHGYGRRQGGLQGARSDRRVCQRPGAQSRFAALQCVRARHGRKYAAYALAHNLVRMLELAPGLATGMSGVACSGEGRSLPHDTPGRLRQVRHICHAGLG